MASTGCGNPDCICNEPVEPECVACDFEDFAGDSLAHLHATLTDSLRADDRAYQTRSVVHALQILEELLDLLYPDEDDD